MRSWFLAVLMASITMGVIGLVYIALTPKLSKHYSPKGLYTIWLVILLGLVIPIRPIFPQSLFSIKQEAPARALPLHSLVGILGEYGDWWHVCLSPYQQAQGYEYGYFYPLPRADDENLVTGFIYQPGFTDNLKQVYRAVIDIKDETALTLTLSETNVSTNSPLQGGLCAFVKRHPGFHQPIGWEANKNHRCFCIHPRWRNYRPYKI